MCIDVMDGVSQKKYYLPLKWLTKMQDKYLLHQGDTVDMYQSLGCFVTIIHVLW